MGTRCLVTVMEGNQEILNLYQQFGGYPSGGMGDKLKKLFKGWKIVNGYREEHKKSGTVSNTMGCFAATLVKRLKDGIGNVYLYPPEKREVGEEFIYRLSEKDGRLWLDISDEPGTKPDLMNWLYSGYLDDANMNNLGTIYHG